MGRKGQQEGTKREPDCAANGQCVGDIGVAAVGRKSPSKLNKKGDRNNAIAL